ncbi:MAG: heat-inducible transcriptional repressor HrcA [Pseudomonadota bacterium]
MTSTNLLRGSQASVSMLDDRSRRVFQEVVDQYVESGEPVGSRTLSRRLDLGLSPATIRNVMADLEDAGLLQAPHTSAGRVPTEAGLRLFVDGFLQMGDLSPDERARIEADAASSDRNVTELLEEVTRGLSGLSQCAGLVVSPKTDRPLRHIEFVPVAPGRAMVILANVDGMVENRMIEVPHGTPQSVLAGAADFLSARIAGRTIAEASADIVREIEHERGQIDALTAKVVRSGLAVPAGDGGSLILKGQSHLLDDVTALADLERIRHLFDVLETKEAMVNMLQAASEGEGVQIFIGSENSLFGDAGCSTIIAPFKDGQKRIVGAIGVIGPTRLNYARIIPMVDYTARLVGRLLWNKSEHSDA